MLQKFFGFFALLAGVLNIASDCSTKVQNPRYLFESEKMPAALEAVANPKPKYVNGSTESERDILVAVIDNGVDYLHPLLIEQIDFDYDDGALVGTGLDVLGGDRWPHPRLIDARPFSFGSPSHRGKIDWLASKAVHEGYGDPYSYFSALNDQVVELFLDRLGKEPRWNKTLLRKLDKTNLSLLGLYNLAAMEFKIEEFERVQRSNNLLSEQSLRENPKSSFAGKKRYLLDQPWIMDARSGLPWGINEYLFYIPNGYEFSLWFKQIFQELDIHFGFSESIANLEEYALIPEVPLQSASDMDSAKEALRVRLHSNWYKTRFGYGFNAEALGKVVHFCESLPQDIYLRLQKGDLTQKERKSIVFRELEKTIDLAEAYDLEVNRAGELFERDDRAKALSRLKSKEAYRTLFERLWQTPAWKLYSCDTTTMLEYLSEQEKTYKKEYRNPLLSEASMPLHGTHVAGTIAYQNQEIGIVPVRVLTSGTRFSKQNNRSFRVDFLRAWNTWISDHKMQPFLSEALPEVFDEPIDPVKVFSKLVADDILAHAIDYRFLDQLVEGIEYVGRRNIPIANVSLGTEFSKSYGIYDDVDQQKNISSFFSFLKYEFFKYLVGKSMQEKAGNTLFVVAAGNSGKWVDGKSRSALPCDITSPFFRVEGGDKIYMPNNEVKNILCVGSLNKQHKLSSFSNLVLGKTPLVFARGEAILAPVTSGACQGSDQEFDKNYPEKMVYASLFGSEGSEQILAKLGQIEPRDPAISDKNWENYVRSKALQFINRLAAGLPIIKAVAKEKACMDKPAQVAYLTGTSMATPSVAGYIADFVMQERLQGYTPEQLIKKVISKSEPYGGGSILKNVPVIKDIKLLNDER